MFQVKGGLDRLSHLVVLWHPLNGTNRCDAFWDAVRLMTFQRDASTRQMCESLKIYQRLISDCQANLTVLSASIVVHRWSTLFSRPHTLRQYTLVARCPGCSPSRTSLQPVQSSSSLMHVSTKPRRGRTRATTSIAGAPVAYVPPNPGLPADKLPSVRATQRDRAR